MWCRSVAEKAQIDEPERFIDDLALEAGLALENLWDPKALPAYVTSAIDVVWRACNKLDADPSLAAELEDLSCFLMTLAGAFSDEGTTTLRINLRPRAGRPGTPDQYRKQELKDLEIALMVAKAEAAGSVESGVAGAMAKWEITRQSVFEKRRKFRRLTDRLSPVNRP